MNFVGGREVAFESCWGEIANDASRIDTATCDLDGLGVDIAGENLQFDFFLGGGDGFPEEDGDRVGLFAGSAGGDPDSQRCLALELVQHFGKEILFQVVEDIGVTKEGGDADEEILAQGICFVGFGIQVEQVLSHVVELEESHSAFDPTKDHILAIGAKVKMGFMAE